MDKIKVRKYKCFLFDLDGTLVNTDALYTKVWNIILQKYHIQVDEEFFKYYIQGKTDRCFLKTIISEISEDEIKNLSNQKDKLFQKEIDSCDHDILIDGVSDFIKNDKEHRKCIVTSSNKKSAEKILEHVKLIDYFDFIISSEDVLKHKPDPLPYQTAVKKYKVNNNEVIIFEDSLSGYKSAKQIHGAGICLIVNNNSHHDILNSKEIQISSYKQFNISEFRDESENNISDQFQFLLRNHLEYLPITEICADTDIIKTGYICDITSYTLNYIDSSQIDKIILKLSNDDNQLSVVAKKINLYDNEINFYKNISPIINVKTPKFYKDISIFNKNGVILEKLDLSKGQFNINLNKNVDLMMKVISEVSDMHNKFMFRSINEIIPCMTNLKMINEIHYYGDLIKDRFDSFLKKNNLILSEKEINLMSNIRKNFSIISKKTSQFPLNFCHGDLKSPNIYYKNNTDPVFLDWQYIHLNKGISDIAFLLVESIDFDVNKIDMALKYYFLKTNQYDDFSSLLFDFKLSLCVFPFFVCVWFNSEMNENLLDKIFPIKFMRNLLKYYQQYIDYDFFNSLRDVKIGASLFSSNLLNIKNETQKAIDAGCNYLHIDIMDGSFVNNISLGFDMLSQLKKEFNLITLDVHLMVNDAALYVNDLINIGVNSISFHVESNTNIIDTVNLIKKSDIKVGLAINPQTSIQLIKNYVKDVDYILFMSVNPGFSGQPFDESVIDKIKNFKKEYPSVYIQVDGGVTINNISRLYEVGVRSFVSGSHIFKSMDYRKTIDSLRNSI